MWTVLTLSVGKMGCCGRNNGDVSDIGVGEPTAPPFVISPPAVDQNRETCTARLRRHWTYMNLGYFILGAALMKIMDSIPWLKLFVYIYPHRKHE